MLYRIRLFLFIQMIIVSSANGQNKTIVCLTYDDGLSSHLSTVIPQLDAVNFKATFFLNSIRGSSEKIGSASEALMGWRAAAKNGHELANHTLFHPCPEALGWQKGYSIETYSVQNLLTEIRLSNQFLFLIDGQKRLRNFAFPCNNFVIHDTDYTTQLKSSSLIKYARAGGDANSIVPGDLKTDLHKIPSWLVEEGASLKQIIAFAEKARAARGIAVYQFHGIGAEFFRVDATVHKQFLDWLKTNNAEYEVMTFDETAKFMAEKKSL